MSSRFFTARAHPRVKVCGLTTAADAQATLAAGVDAIGINFWPGSKRFIPAAQAATWLRDLAGAITRIGLFVNATRDEILAVKDLGVLDAIQLHGDESPGFCAEIVELGLPVIRAIGVKGDAPVHHPDTFPGTHLLLDADAPGEYGGTGRGFRWEIAARLKSENPARFLILAGGLEPGNVAAAIQAARPDAVDVASGVELRPGVKDAAKVRDFVAACRG